MIDEQTASRWTGVVGMVGHMLDVHEESKLKRTRIICACVTVCVIALAIASSTIMGECS